MHCSGGEVPSLSSGERAPPDLSFLHTVSHLYFSILSLFFSPWTLRGAQDVVIAMDHTKGQVSLNMDNGRDKFLHSFPLCPSLDSSSVVNPVPSLILCSLKLVSDRTAPSLVCLYGFYKLSNLPLRGEMVLLSGELLNLVSKRGAETNCLYHNRPPLALSGSLVHFLS